jgi:hypothetical protein
MSDTYDTKSLALLGPGFAIGTEERIERSLNGTLPAHIPPLSVGKIDNVSRSRIRRALAELAQGNMPHVERWLHELANGEFDAEGKCIRAPNKGAAIAYFLELMKFTVPQVKAVTLDVSEKGNGKRYSMAELQSIVSEQ